VSPAQRSSHSTMGKCTTQATMSGLALFGASDLFPQIEAITAMTDQVRAIASLASEALPGAASAYSLISDLSSSIPDIQSMCPLWKTAGAVITPALLDTGFWDGLDKIEATALSSAQFTHTALAEVQPLFYDPIIRDIGIEKDLSALAQVSTLNIVGDLPFDLDKSLQKVGVGPAAVMNQAILGGTASPFAIPFRGFADGAAAQIESMFQPASTQSIFGQVGALVTDHIGSYTQTLLDAVAFQPLSWMDSIRDSFIYIGRHWSYILCDSAAQALQEGDQEHLHWFTTHVLGLSASCEADVAIAVWEGRWRKADEPFDYLRRAVGNMRRKAFRRDNPRLPEDMTLLSLDSSRSHDEPLVDLIGELCSRFPDIELFADLEQGCQRANLPQEAFKLIIARLQDFKRDEMAALFSWTPQQVARIWKAIERQRNRLRYFVAARL
jgi:hypothetical protein